MTWQKQNDSLDTEIGQTTCQAATAHALLISSQRRDTCAAFISCMQCVKPWEIVVVMGEEGSAVG